MSTSEPHREGPEEPEDTRSEETPEEDERRPVDPVGDPAAEPAELAEAGPDTDSDADIDAEFARIVAAWEHEADEAPEQAPEQAPPEPGPRPAPGYDPAALDRQAFTGWTPAAPDPVPPRPRAEDDEPGWRSYSVSEEDHYIPPPPPPLPAGDLGFWGIVVGLVLGPLILVLNVGLGLGSGSIWPILGGGLSLLGVTLLILRLPRDRDPHDPGNGAQV